MLNRFDLVNKLLYIKAADRDLERRGRNVLVVAACLCLASICVSALVATRPDGHITAAISMVMAGIYAANVMLARRGYVSAAAYTLTASTMVVILVNALVTHQIRVAPYTFMISVLLAGLTLPPRGVGLILAGCYAALAIMGFELSAVPQEQLPTAQILAIVAVLTSVVAIISSLGARGFAQTLADVQASRRAAEASEAEARRLAWCDPLTGLANRRRLQQHLQEIVGRSPGPNDSSDAVLLLDLDRFKTINDSLGHVIGDQLLKNVAERLQSVVRPLDTVARLGGDEFAVVLHGLGAADAAGAIAERIHACFRSPFELHGSEVFTSTSIGIVLVTPDYHAPEDLLRDADSALYRAKAAGKARSALFDTAMHQAAMVQLELEADLRHAVARGEFRLEYQPIIALGTGRVLSIEALLRWPHPTRGMVSPAEFIPLAEETGLIVPLGNWALRTACLHLQQLHRAGWTELKLAVNLSPRQFRNGSLLATIRDVLHESGIPAACLEIELTETSLMDDVDSAMLQLQAINALGLRIAVDDFGTGYSSLAYLKRFPIDTLKIDRAFITDCAHDKHDAAIVGATIAIARSLGLSTIAEGVETGEQLEVLQANGCEAVQGYYFSRPLPPAALAEWLASPTQTAARERHIPAPAPFDARTAIVVSA